ncbi:MMPL family transporter [Natrarchaeobius chitinivorans]|uniref:RND transporter n=1 Tax=Natrarchaeobius chitinivorans TaxID=1679083 RepID=A0A3N6LR90_NATCH|nr:MMPL family transporter [Natrarchaeobius chitinivorans]RQG92213.1 RND transporter [Natrarchaeobius chitinivorans]
MGRDLADRYANAVVGRSAIVVAVVLLLTALVGAGAVVNETEDAGIGEFETDSEEQAALEYVEENYETDDRIVTQLVVREDGGDVLTRESLLEGLALQAEARENESVTETLDDDGFVGVENVVATAAHTEDRIEEFEERGEELGERGEELEARSDALEAGLDDVREIQRAYERLNATTDESDPAYQESAAELEAEFETAVENATEAAELDDEKAAEYENLTREIRGLESAQFGIEQATDEPEETAEYQETTEAIEGVYAAATVGLLEKEFETLEEEFEALEAERDAFEEDDGPTLDEQIAALEDRSDEAVEQLLADVLDPDSDAGSGQDPTVFVPQGYEPGDTSADARITFFFQEGESAGDETGNGGAEAGDDDPSEAADDDLSEPAAEAQLEVQSLFEERFDDGFVFGEAITDAATSSAVGDSFAIITPVALVAVLAILAITYRDVVDVVIGLAGIGVVMAWLAGLLGWLQIPTSQLLIAVPFLLIGLSIDYALHVVMRYREARAGTLEIGGPELNPDSADRVPDDSDSRLREDSSGQAPARDDGRSSEVTDGVARGVRAGMVLGLGGVVLALAVATFSTGVGFLSNVVSPLPAIRDFAILAAGGIFATFVAFGVFVPALKVEVDGLLEKRSDRTRAKPAFGVTPGPINRVLSSGVVFARRAPLAVVLVALLLAVGGAYGATGIDTEFNEADFLPQDGPDWAKSLPGPLAPDTYTIADDAEYLADNFQDPDSQAEILIRGDVTDPTTLAAIEDARENAETGDDATIDARSDGTAAVEGPLTVLEAVADDDQTVADGLDERDTTGDGVPDEDLAGLYDLLYEADSDEASTVLDRTEDGEYESARLIVSVRGDESAQAVADDVRALASGIESETGSGASDGGDTAFDSSDTTIDSSDAPVTAVATGGPVTTAVVQDALLETLVQALAVTLVVIGAFLTILYWVRHRALSLGLVTLAPVVIALAWLLGTMALLDVPFNSETAVITSLAIGLGVDYSIHLGERFVVERERRGVGGADSRDGTTSDGEGTDRDEAVEEALEATVTGTGGALLGSAATTATGFGVLALALAPPLQRFGIVTGVSIVFAFVACLTVLPCLLVLRERFLGWRSAGR